VSDELVSPVDGGHYREMAARLRELARETRSPGIRRELIDLARRYDRRGDHFDSRSIGEQQRTEIRPPISRLPAPRGDMRFSG
jgi:hypothetical protein